jgi:hypothetical protein
MVNKNDGAQTVNCELVWREISNYIDGDVDVTLRSAMEKHFETCAHCQSVLAGARNVTQLYSDDRMIDELSLEVPAGYSRRLEKRLAQTARASRSRWLSPSLSAWLVPVAALALIAGGLFLANSLGYGPLRAFHHSQPPQVPPDMIVVVSTDTDSKLFHVAGCHLIHDQKVRSLTAKEAIDQGYSPCPQCLRKYVSVTGNQLPNEDDDHDIQANAAIREGR